jgi:hypothetical protein
MDQARELNEIKIEIYEGCNNFNVSGQDTLTFRKPG